MLENYPPMKKRHLLLSFLSVLTISMNAFAQQKRVLDPGNMRQGETIEYCTQHKKQAELMKNPAYVKSKELDDAEFEMLSKKVVRKKQRFIKSRLFFMYYT